MDGKLLSRTTPRRADTYKGDLMTRKAVVLLAICLACIQPVFSETFQFKFTKGEKYRIVATVDEKVYRNGKIQLTTQILNRISAEVIATENGKGRISAINQTSERASINRESYVLQEEYPEDFWQDEHGTYVVEPEYLYPITRDIPLFPDHDIKPGDSWTAPAKEVHDLRPYGIPLPYILNFNITYTYVGKTTVAGKTLDQFNIQYSYYHKVRLQTKPPDNFYPVGISGEVTMVYYWDNKTGKVASYDDNFDIFYYLATGEEYEFTGTSHGEFIMSTAMDREQTRKAITDEIQKQQIPDVKVEAVDEGIKITLDNIQFEPDSDVLIPSERQKLDRIADILKQYPDRDLAVVGHAARWGTEKAQMELSISRAKAVADYLLKKGVRSAAQMTTIGKGATQPVADNGTEAGRIKNRRVEILILEN
jgi:outer membrane protein OmpA-like peptidoglycan-associated protein